MAIMANTDNRFVNLEKKIGAFILVAFFGVILISGFIALQRDFFSTKVRLYTVADSGNGLIVGMPVKLNGFKIGKLNKLYLDDIARVKLELLINKDYMKWIKSDSKITLVKEGLIGEPVLEISHGSKEVLNLKETTPIPFERDVELTEIADEMRLEIKQLIADVRGLVEDVDDPQGDMKVALKNFNHLSKELLVTLKTIDESVGRVGGILGQTELAVKRIKGSAENIDSNIPEILNQIDRSMANLEQVTEDMSLILKRVAPEIPAAIDKGGQVLEEAEDVLGALKRVWPIRNGLEEKKHEMQSVDSYE